MAWLREVDLQIPIEWRELINLVWMGFLLVVVTNAVLEVGYIRHRWRLVLFVSRILGLISGFLFMAWPCTLLFIPQAVSVVNAFADPRFHFESFQRNPSRVWAFSLLVGALLHHAGCARMLANFCAEVVASDERTVMVLPVPVLVAIAVEISAWIVDIHVLMHKAPKWFWALSAGNRVVQTLALFSSLLFVTFPDDQIVPIVATTAGNVFLFINFVTGHGASTYERFQVATRCWHILHF